MTFDEFKQNVETWAAERGIYDHSTPEAQLLKALSELGELADAVIKNDIDGIKDGVGDVAVCMVNFAHMADRYFDMEDIENHIEYYVDANFAVATIAIIIGELITDETIQYPEEVIAVLISLSESICGLVFLDCCEHAWNQIKFRTGRMVPGGAFVKDK